MKLYNLDLSPYAARCRIQIYAKGLDVDLAEPPGGLATDAYEAVNPTGKVPALQLDDGGVLPESQVICEYLEDRFPKPALRPDDPLARARMRLLARFADLYLAPALTPLFGQVNPKTRDAQVVSSSLEELQRVLDLLETLLGAGPYAAGAALSLADCALVPFFHFTVRALLLLGDKDPTLSRPRLATWWKTVQAEPAVKRVQDEINVALVEWMKSQA